VYCFVMTAPGLNIPGGADSPGARQFREFLLEAAGGRYLLQRLCNSPNLCRCMSE